MLEHIPYILLFAFATMIIYGWGLYKSVNRNRDLGNMLAAKGISKIKKALKKNNYMTKKELEEVVKNISVSQPFSKDRLGVINPKDFINSLIPYMIKQKIIVENKKGNNITYSLYKNIKK